MTMVHQLLDISINFPFKNDLKYLFSEYLSIKKELNSKEILS